MQKVFEIFDVFVEAKVIVMLGEDDWEEIEVEPKDLPHAWRTEPPKVLMSPHMKPAEFGSQGFSFLHTLYQGCYNSFRHGKLLWHFGEFSFEGFLLIARILFLHTLYQG